jgi:hypothetical protein
MSNARTLLLAPLVALVGVVGTSGQSGAPPVDPTIAELRAMRAELNERLEANIRVQLLVARLTLQEQRTNVVVRQLADVSDKMRTHEQTKVQMEGVNKMFGDLKATEEDEDNFFVSMLRAQKEAVAKTDSELKQQHAELTTALAQEQARWAAFNAQLAELERLFEKPRR